MITIDKLDLSESTDGKNISVVATSSPGTLIHTAAGIGSIDEVYIHALNEDCLPLELTIEWGGLTTADSMTVSVPAFTADMLVIAAVS